MLFLYQFLNFLKSVCVSGMFSLLWLSETVILKKWSMIQMGGTSKTEFRMGKTLIKEFVAACYENKIKL